jgi:hypothetical protein
MKLPTTLTSIDTSADLIGLDFEDKGHPYAFTIDEEDS